MSIAVKVPTILRTYTAGESEVSVDPSEPTLSATITALESAYPGLSARVLDDAGADDPGAVDHQIGRAAHVGKRRNQLAHILVARDVGT